MGSKYYLDYKGTITANYSWNEFDTSFEIIIFKCQDPNCLQCTYDPATLLTGSSQCVTCAANYTFNANGTTCI